MEGGDVVVVGCRRDVNPQYPHVTKADKTGVTINLHWLKGRSPSDPVPESYLRMQEPSGDHERADITTLHAVYTDLLSALSLDQEDRADLKRRGYSDEMIERIGFKSWPESDKPRARVVADLHNRYGADLLSVPGFRTGGPKAAEDLSFDHNGAVIVEEPELEMAGCPGYFLPITDEEGRIVGLQVRPRDGKYIAFSSPVGGASAGLHVHIPKGRKPKDGKAIVTEGVHKANLASQYLDAFVIGLPSIAMIELALPTLGALGVKVVELAYDADVRDKPSTAAPLRRAAHRLAEQGYETHVLTWPSAAGKGLDDVVTRPELSPEADERDGKNAITVLQGRAMWTWIKDVCRLAKLPKDPILDGLLDARIRIASLLETVEKDPSLAFRAENIEAVAALDRASPETITLLDKFQKALGGRYATWEEKLGDAQTLLSKKKRILKAHQSGKQVFRSGSHTEIGLKILEAYAHDHQGKTDHKFAKYANGYLHIYVHEKGVWQPIERAKIATLVQGWDESPIISSGKSFKADVGPISGGIKCACDRVEDKTFFSEAPRGLAFANGFVRVVDGELVLDRHASTNRALHAYPFDYDAAAGEPVEWLRALDELWLEDEDKDQKILYIQEFVGASLMGDANTWQKATVLWGPTSQNGKSSLNAALRSIFLPGMTSSVQPQHFKEKFRLAELAGKLANFVDELSGQYLQDSDLIKWIITGKTPITAERKNQDPFEFLPRAGHFWNCNSLPAADEMGEAFFRRFTVLFFNRRFEGANDKPMYLEGIAERERAQIVLWALKGYARLLRNRRYTIPKSAQEHADAWKRKADQVVRFVDDCLIVSEAPKAEKDKLLKLDAIYNLYKTWAAAENSKKTPLYKDTLAERLKALGYEYRTSDWRGYRLKVSLKTVEDDLHVEDVNKPNPIARAMSQAMTEEEIEASFPPSREAANDDLIEQV
jgi:P4 family phage/plasmid primase-like protien